MNKVRNLSLAALFLAAMACTNNDNHDETYDEDETALENGAQGYQRGVQETAENETFAQDADERMDNLRADINEAIAEIDEEMKEASNNVNEGTAKVKEDLREKKEELERDLANLKNKTADEWDEFEAEVEARIEKIKANRKDS